MNDSSVGIRAVKAPRSVLFLLKKGCRQASLVQGGSQRTNTGSNSWSSTENSENNAWNVNFNDGNRNNNNKNITNNVRAVLAFSI